MPKGTSGPTVRPAPCLRGRVGAEWRRSSAQTPARAQASARGAVLWGRSSGAWHLRLEGCAPGLGGAGPLLDRQGWPFPSGRGLLQQQSLAFREGGAFLLEKVRTHCLPCGRGFSGRGSWLHNRGKCELFRLKSVLGPLGTETRTTGSHTPLGLLGDTGYGCRGRRFSRD